MTTLESGPEDSDGEVAMISTDPSVDVRWSIDGGPMVALEPALFTTEIATEELARIANAEKLGRGWGLW